jgi:hypothetical protein
MPLLGPLAAALLDALLAAEPASDRAGAFAPGEETVMQVRFLGMPSGEGRLSVGRPAGDVWPIIFQARTDGVAGFFDVREHVVSYWDSARRQTRGFDLRAYEVGDFKVERARFDRAGGQVTFERQLNGARTRSTVAIPRDAQDLTSAIMLLRLQRLAPGDHVEVPVCTGRRQFTLVADVLGRERIDTPAGSFDTVKVQVRTALEGKFSTRRDTFAWLSDDPRHVIVRMSADFAVGGLVATLKTYRPGTEVARAAP